jgi:hypothetical protein
VEKRVKEYMIAFLVLETLMIGVFCALDLVLFYVFFEAGLIPMFLIIGIWGGKRRVYASYKFFLYTLLGSVLMLAGHHGHVLAGRHDRHPDTAGARLPGQHADLAVARLLRLLRGEDADVASPYLAARRARGGADGRLRHPGRRSCSRWAATASCASRCRCSRSPRRCSRPSSSRSRSSPSSTPRWWR